MLVLFSNGNKVEGQEWQGTDPQKIEYPDVSTCITITCVGSYGLAGIHLANVLLTTETWTDADLKIFARSMKGAGQMYVVGMLSNWTNENKKNRTGLVYDQDRNGGDMMQKLCNKLKYKGSILYYDLSKLGADSEIKVIATLQGPVAKLEYSIKAQGAYAGSTVIGSLDFETCYGQPILPSSEPRNAPHRQCVIL